jgi:hypothetical protein
MALAPEREKPAHRILHRLRDVENSDCHHGQYDNDRNDQQRPLFPGAYGLPEGEPEEFGKESDSEEDSSELSEAVDL